ncbi:protein takeout-like [Uranotaenia lowii]|uniref:protein takeout-like n=1 Tax=Uranotaenia lowii TaxID=190385 RepID=UPI0024794261|nr:protein takeout-like [Uranotaenia lowii]
MPRITCLVIITTITHFCVSKDLPSTFQRCQREESDFDSCLMEAINGAIPQLTNGMSEFGILPIDPLLVNSLTIEQGTSSPINLKQDFKNVKLKRLSQSKVTSIKTDLKKFSIKAEAITPYMEFIGDYVMTGRVLLLPVTGKGFSNITLQGLTTKHELIGEPVKKKDQTYMRIKKYIVKFEDPKLVTVKFENLFNGDKALGDAMNKVMNDNWLLMFNELRGAYEDTFGYIFRDISNKIFLKVPMNKIFLENYLNVFY